MNQKISAIVAPRGKTSDDDFSEVFSACVCVCERGEAGSRERGGEA